MEEVFAGLDDDGQVKLFFYALGRYVVLNRENWLRVLDEVGEDPRVPATLLLVSFRAEDEELPDEY